ncbi:MAG TPA: hypothetical protein VE861_01925, partial [Gemmatimonadaceae bacterium]|nr:hypothetical protein [Gemmatimonadaceae bacterium]
MPMSRWCTAFVVALVVSVAPALRAQPTPIAADSAPHGRAATVALTGALIVAGAGGAQILHTP